MISRTACYHLNTADILNLLIRHLQLLNHNFPVLYSGTDGVCHCFWLFIDFLQHKMLKAFFFCCLGVPLYSFKFLLYFFLVFVVKLNGICCNFCNFPILNITYCFCIFQNRRNIRSNKISLFRFPNNQRAVFSHCIQNTWVFLK